MVKPTLTSERPYSASANWTKLACGKRNGVLSGMDLRSLGTDLAKGVFIPTLCRPPLRRAGKGVDIPYGFVFIIHASQNCRSNSKHMGQLPAMSCRKGLRLGQLLDPRNRTYSCLCQLFHSETMPPTRWERSQAPEVGDHRSPGSRRLLTTQESFRYIRSRTFLTF